MAAVKISSLFTKESRVMHLPVTVTWAHRDGDFFDDGDDDGDDDDDDNDDDDDDVDDGDYDYDYCDVDDDDDDDGMLILGADGAYI